MTSNSRGFGAVIFLFWLSMGLAVRADIVYVWLFAGQSNMIGSGHVDHLPSGFPLVQDQVLYTHDSDDVPPEPWGPLQPRLTSNLSTRRWYGPELTFGKEFTERAPNRKLGIIKFARPSTSLAKHWSPTGAVRQQFYQFVDQSLADLELLGHTPVIRGMVWVQGEGDALSVINALAYGSRLRGFLNELRLRYDVPEMILLFNQAHVRLGRPYTSQLRQSQANFAQSASFTWMINIDDLPLKRDLTHFTSYTHQELGRRFAAIAAIPEPSGCWAVLMCCATWLVARRSRKSVRDLALV